MINAIADQVTANKAAAAETTEEEKDND
jgi:hypothetical protein